MTMCDNCGLNIENDKVITTMDKRTFKILGEYCVDCYEEYMGVGK